MTVKYYSHRNKILRQSRKNHVASFLKGEKYARLNEATEKIQNPKYQATQNNEIMKALRKKAYEVESDSIYFEFQRQEKTRGDWMQIVTGIKNRFPYDN